MEVSRRALLRTAALAAPAVALAGCGLTPAQTVALAATDLGDATNIISAIEEVLGDSALASTLAPIVAQVNTYIGDAVSAIQSLAGQVNTLVPVSTVSGVLTDLTQAVNAVAKVVPNNNYLGAAQLLLATLTVAWQAVSAATGAKVTAAPPYSEVASARALLRTLPAPAKLAGIPR